MENKYILAIDYSIKVEIFEPFGDINMCTYGETQKGNWLQERVLYNVSFEGKTTNSEVEYLDNINFTT